MDLKLEIVLTQVAPAGVACAIVLLVLWRRRRDVWTAALAAAAGVVTGDVLRRGGAWPEWAPTDATNWFPHLAVMGFLTAMLLDARRVPRAVAWGVSLAVAACVPWLLTRQAAVAPWLGEGADSPWLWWGAMGGAVAGLWAVQAWRGAVVPGAAQPLALLVAAAGSGRALELAHSAKLAQMAGVCAAVVVPHAAFALLGRDLKPGRGAVQVVALVLPGLLICGHFYGSELPLTSVALLAAAPLLVVPRWWLSPLLAAVPTTAAVYLAMLANPPSPY